jgi:hypothetical protein
MGFVSGRAGPERRSAETLSVARAFHKSLKEVCGGGGEEKEERFEAGMS